MDQQLPKVLRNKLWWASVVLGCLWFCYSPGWTVLNPLEVNHLFVGDKATHYLGWAFYRDSAPNFPLGKVDPYFAPVGTNVGYTDSIPLMAFLLKPLSDLFPTDFQYIGIWLLLSMILQGWYTWKLLVRLGAKQPLGIAAGTLLVMVSPIWYWRMMHPALCAHWLIIGSIYYYVAAFQGRSLRPIIAWQLVLAFLASLIHPYLTTMTLGLGLTWWFSAALFDVRVKWWQAVLGIVASIMLVLVGWYVVGYFEISSEGAPSLGLGAYSFNLNAFFDSFGQALVLPSLPHGKYQYEGYAYLGAGGILLSVLALALGRAKVKSESNRRMAYLPLWIVLVLMGLFALSPIVTLGEVTLLEIKLGGALRQIAEIFRSTGRFIWPVYYGWIIWMMARWLRRDTRWSAWVMGGLLVFQVVDCWPLWQAQRVAETPPAFSHMDTQAWDQLISAADSVILWPPFERKYAHGDDDYAFFGWRGHTYHKPVTSGYVARIDYSQTDPYRHSLEKRLNAGQLSPRSLHVSSPDEVTEVVEGLYDKPTLLLDGYLVNIGPGNPLLTQVFEQLIEKQGGTYDWPVEVLSQFVTKHHDHLVLLAVKDEATYGLSEGAKAALRAVGVTIDQLAFRGSMAAMIYQGQTLWQAYGGDQAVEQVFPAGTVIQDFRIEKRIDLYSAGVFVGNDAIIKVDGQKRGPSKRGINFVVCTTSGLVIDDANFDTYRASVRLLPR